MASPFHIISNSAEPGLPATPESHPRPPWLRVRFFGGENYQDLKRIMRTLDLHTVCESARCPNMGECWEHRTATFMILGNICTRACGFCAVPSGKPVGPPDEDEPERVADAVERMGLRYAVVTSVNRDDQPDGGSAIFAAHDSRDSRARAGLQGRSADSGFSRRLAGAGNRACSAPGRAQSQYRNRAAPLSQVRRGAVYERSLELLRRAKQFAPAHAGQDRHDAGPGRDAATKCSPRWRIWSAKAPTS